MKNAHLDRIDRQLVALVGPGVVKTRVPSTRRELCKARAKEIVAAAREAAGTSLRDHAEALELRSHKTVEETEKYGKRLEALVDLMMADSEFYARVVEGLSRWHRYEKTGALKVAADE